MHIKFTHAAVVSHAYALKVSKKNILGVPDINCLKLLTMSNAKSHSNDNFMNTLPVVGNDNKLANNTVDVAVGKSTSEKEARCVTGFETTVSSERFVKSSDTSVRRQGQSAAKTVTVLNDSIKQKVVSADLPIMQNVKDSWM